MLPPELAQRNALAVAGLGQHEQIRARVRDAHRDDLVALPRESDADDAGGHATHRPDLALREPRELAEGRREDQVAAARRDVHPRQLVVTVEGDGDDAARSDAIELLERRLLD